jgi:hypothetical protein
VRSRVHGRLNREVAGEDLPHTSGLASRMEGRADEPAPRVVAGEAVHPRSVETRRPRGVIELGQPAPLLIRLMRRKSTLEATARARVEGRPALEPRERPLSPAAEVSAALSERAPADRSLPSAELRAVAPRGMTVSRLAGEA